MDRMKYSSCLLCGGKGTRLRSLTKDLIPKSLVLLAGKELLLYTLESLDPRFVSELIFAVDHQSEALRDWIDEKHLPHIVKYSSQQTTGVVSAILSASSISNCKTIIICNTDEIRLGLQLEKALAFHESGDQLLTIVATYSTDLYRHRVLEIDDEFKITKTRLKDEAYKDNPIERGLVNTGLVILETSALEYTNPTHSSDWSGIIDPLVWSQKARAYTGSDIRYFNVGTESEFNEVSDYLKQNTTD